MLSVLAALVMMAANAAGHHVDSGVKGVVTIGPTCPGPVRVQSDPRCSDRPYETTLKVLRRRDHVLVKRFSSHSDGCYLVHLVAGCYLIEQFR